MCEADEAGSFSYTKGVLRYEKPALFSFQGLRWGEAADCLDGSLAVGTCTIGSGASPECDVGYSAGDTCKAGVNAIVKCTSGSTAG